MPSTEYTDAILAKVRDTLSAEEFQTLHKLALPSAGGRAAARKRREARGDVAKAEAAADDAFDADDLDPDVYGAMFELSEFGGLTGDEGIDPQFKKLPKPVQLAIHTISEWCAWDEEAAEGDAGEAAEEGIEKADQPGSGDFPLMPMNSKKKLVPHKFVGDGKVCTTCGQPAGYIAHQQAGVKGKVAAAIKKASGRDKPMVGSYEDIQAQLQEALRAKYASSLGNSYVYTRSTTATTVAFTVDGGSSSGSYQCDYKIEDGKVVLGEPAPVEFRTIAVTKADFSLDSAVWIEKGEKQAQQIVYGVVLSPGVKDSQGDGVTAEEIEKAAHSFLIKQQRQISKAAHNRQHKPGAVDAEPVESYIAPVDFEVQRPDGTVAKVLKGAWVMATKVHDATLFAEIEKGEKVTGFSIEGNALRYEDAA